MEKINSINVYWSPAYEVQNGEIDWNQLYYEPESVYDSIKNQKNNEVENNLLNCPAFLKTYKNTYIFYNSLDSKFTFNENEIVPLSKKGYISLNRREQNSLKYKQNLIYNLRWLFFCNEPLTVTISSPYFHNPKYLQSAAICPGSFDIGQWLRTVSLELITWENKGEIFFKENDPLFYIQFQTDNNIIMNRFVMNEKIQKYLKSTDLSSTMIESGVSLKKRYERFNKTKTKDIVFSEIKKAVIL